MKTLVTGGAGFIGSTVARQLLERQHEVTVLDNLTSGYRINVPTDVRFIEGDVRDEVAVARAAENAEVIFHLAASVGNSRAINDPVTDSMVNVIGTLNVLEAARHAGTRKIIYSSSAAIFGELTSIPISENHPLEPDSPYGASKLAGEKHALCYGRIHGIEAVCLRYFNVYGENQRYDAYGNVIPIFATRLLQGQPLTIFGDGEQTRDFINVADVARANVMAGESRGVSGAFNLGSGTRITINSLVRLLEDASGLSAHVVYAPHRAGDVLHSLADLSSICQTLGFRPEVRMPDGLANYVNWLRSDMGQIG